MPLENVTMSMCEKHVYPKNQCPVCEIEQLKARIVEFEKGGLMSYGDMLIAKAEKYSHELEARVGELEALLVGERASHNETRQLLGKSEIQLAAMMQNRDGAIAVAMQTARERDDARKQIAAADDCYQSLLKAKIGVEQQLAVANDERTKLAEELYEYKIQFTPDEIKIRAGEWDKVLDVVKNHKGHLGDVRKIHAAIKQAFDSVDQLARARDIIGVYNDMALDHAARVTRKIGAALTVHAATILQLNTRLAAARTLLSDCAAALRITGASQGALQTADDIDKYMRDGTYWGWESLVSCLERYKSQLDRYKSQLSKAREIIGVYNDMALDHAARVTVQREVIDHLCRELKLVPVPKRSHHCPHCGRMTIHAWWNEYIAALEAFQKTINRIENARQAHRQYMEALQRDDTDAIWQAWQVVEKELQLTLREPISEVAQIVADAFGRLDQMNDTIKRFILYEDSTYGAFVLGKENRMKFQVAQEKDRFIIYPSKGCNVLVEKTTRMVQQFVDKKDCSERDDDGFCTESTKNELCVERDCKKKPLAKWVKKEE